MREYVWLERKPLEHLWKRCVFASFGICAVFEVEKRESFGIRSHFAFQKLQMFPHVI